MSRALPPALAEALASARQRLEPAAAWVRARRFWVECGLLSAAAVLCAALVGRAAVARADALETEAARLQAVRSRVDGWLARVQRPAPAETAGWRESERALLSLAVEESGALAASRLVARRAEEVGVRDLRITLASPDSAAVSPAALVTGPWRVEPASTALLAEFSGPWELVVAVLGALPPQVEVVDLEVAEREGRQHARLLLLTRRAVRQP